MANAAPGGGDDAFVFVDMFTHEAGQAMLRYDEALGVTRLSLDVDGDAAADLELLINGRLDPSSDWLL